ncbi:phosphoribosyltransferase [Schlegelella sp. S2-27]|uniref:Phosphoribosyltransferase n=1 Tax=Caldimonas mangrovi TaxID=2944811 RepID=A0ABT0YTL2_9BURK|nr:phosphoribosyltransferase family protein [Caldimonas mangrovi]MCM5681973.1 phosphoribosyltransferase [Caldimonas mangrovi]
MAPPLFDDRAHAGRLLAARVKALSLHDPLVIALPRGGVPVGAEVARELQAPLELLLVRKIGAPWQPELAVAAVVDGSPPELVVDDHALRAVGCGRAHVEAQLPYALAEIERRRAAYLGAEAPVDPSGRDVVVVDDGLATGTTARAALRALRRRRVRRLVLAVPVAARESLEALRGEADDVACLSTPEHFEAVSPYYRRFEQLEDGEVVELIRAARSAER